MQALLGNQSATKLLLAFVVAGMVIFGTAIGALMSPYTDIIGMDRLGALTCLQMAGTPERALRFLAEYNATELAAVRGLLIPGDVVFAWGYGLVFSGLLGLLTLRLDGAWRKAGAILMWAPLLASVFDVFEDLGLYNLVSHAIDTTPAELSPTVTLVTTINASIKYFLLAVVGPVYGLLGTFQAVRTHRSAGSWAVYISVVVVAASMAQKPLSEIPACF